MLKQLYCRINNQKVSYYVRILRKYMSKESSTQRLMEILKDLENGKMLCLSELAARYDTSERTIRRDFELIENVFGDIFIKPQKGCFRIVNKQLLDNVLNSTELYMLKNILKLSDKSKLSLSQDIDDKVKEAILKEDTNSPYVFKHKPYEEIYENKEKFKFLEHAIKFRKEITFTYNNLNRVNIFTLKPYKIVFLSENFYLASEIELKNGTNVTISRIAFISDMVETGKIFNHNLDIMNFINYIHSPWATYKPNFRQHLKEVVVEVDKEQAKYFKLKKFFPTQKILSEDENGKLTISYIVTSENEILGLVKQWIPHIKVIKPQSLINQIEQATRVYYEALFKTFKKPDFQ